MLTYLKILVPEKINGIIPISLRPNEIMDEKYLAWGWHVLNGN